MKSFIRKCQLRVPGLILAAGALGCLMAGLVGCVSNSEAGRHVSAETIRSQALGRFAQGVFLKPAESDTMPAFTRQMAPLIILESTAEDLPQIKQSDFPLRKVFVCESAWARGSVTLAQFTYWWTIPARGRDQKPQGIRITLNSKGLPVIWEVLAGARGMKVVYVAESLEAAATREFGGPLPGRRFAVEPPAPTQPAEVVARVLADGPMPMGPILYVRRGAQEIASVICRCMPTQADELLGQAEFELVRLAADSPGDPIFGELSLRLPVHF